MQKFIIAALSVLMLLSVSSTASAFSIGLLTDGSQNLAETNIAHYVADHAGSSYTSISNATFNATSVATLASTYDVLVMPWYVNASANLDWATRIRPYMNAGGGVLWEDPTNLSDLTGSGITFGSTGGYTSAGRTLVAPFDANGAESHYHVHYGITAVTSDWDIFGTDANGSIHGVYGEFGSSSGRMVIGVSDNLYHPNMSNPAEDDHYQLLINELNWIGTGSVYEDPTDPDPTVPEPATILLLSASLLGLGYRRKAKKS